MDRRIVFMGSPHFALPALSALHQNFQVVGVVTQPDRPAGRGRSVEPPEVIKLAQSLNLHIIQPESINDPSVLGQLKEWSPDVIIVAAFGQILRENVLNLPPHGCVNVHASLLPRWRGAAPVQAAILHDEVTGVTIMRMDKGLDTGPILGQRSIPIDETLTGGKLSEILAQMGASLLVELLPKYLSGKIQPQPQDETVATYAPQLKKSDGELDFTQHAAYLARKVRAYHPWPGAFSFFEGVLLKIHRAHAETGEFAFPGRRDSFDGKPALGTTDGWLVLDEVQLAGKRCVSGKEFLRGARDWLQEKENDE